jgi:spore coat protein U-like protein
MKRRIAVPVLLMLGMLPWAELPAQGQTAQTTFQVKATVQAVCEVTATDLSFGNYTSQSGTPLLGTTVVQATCTPNSSYNIGLNAGTSPGATVNTRKMVSGASILNYQLYRDASRSEIWGNTVGVDAVSGSGTGLAQSVTVFGSIPAKQVVPAGNYQDTITVTIYY